MPTTKRSTRAGEAMLLDEVRLAARDFDRDGIGGALGWIVRFAREDAASWPAADREGHGLRLLAFARPELLLPSLVGGTNVKALSAREVTALHAEIGTVLRGLVSGGRAGARRAIVAFPSEGLVTALVRVTAPGVKPATFAMSYGGPLRTMLFQRLASLVAASDRLLACRHCGGPFLALRKMMFCSPKCAERFHDRLKIARRAGAAR